MASLFGSHNAVLIRLAWEASETHFSTGFVQSHLNCFYLSWARNAARLGSEHGPVGLQIVVRLDSGLVSLLGSRTQHEDSTRLDSRLGSVCSRPRSARDLAWLAIRGSVYLGSSRAEVNRGESGSTWGSLGLGESAQCSAQLSSELGSGLSPGLSWGLTGD